MSTRWMAVQYVGDTLRLPVVNEGDMDKPFGSSALERDVKRIVVNPFSDSPQTFVPELENAKLLELARDVNKAAHMLCEAWEGSCSKEAEGMSLYAVCPISDTNELRVFGKLHDRMRELEVQP